MTGVMAQPRGRVGTWAEVRIQTRKRVRVWVRSSCKSGNTDPGSLLPVPGHKRAQAAHLQITQATGEGSMTSRTSMYSMTSIAGSVVLAP